MLFHGGVGQHRLRCPHNLLSSALRATSLEQTSLLLLEAKIDIFPEGAVQENYF